METYLHGKMASLTKLNQYRAGRMNAVNDSKRLNGLTSKTVTVADVTR